ncbi:MAG: sulfite exporter TauE/SafE family protein [Methylococcales bacterium]|nr:sulfite exporter TauE/SafE family protein [Methylococcales bacterium]
MDIIDISAGALVGFIVGLTGVGGGSLMTPILVLGYGINPAVAVGTDLIYAAITKCTGVAFHHRHKTIDWRVVKYLLTGSIPSSLATIAYFSINYEQQKAMEGMIIGTLSVMLILTAILVLLKNKISTRGKQAVGKGFRTHIRHNRPTITIVSGAILGIVVTLSSVGAGAIGTAILFILHPKKSAIKIVGTDVAHAVPLTLIAGAGHLHLGSVDLNLLYGLLIGGIPAVYAGSFLGKKLSDRILRPTIALILFLMGLKLAFN